MELEPRNAVFDEHELLENVGEDEAFATDMVHTFLECQPGMIEALHRAVASRQPKEIERAAHSFKGSLGTLGARRAAGVAAAIEAAAARGALDEALSAAPALDGELAAVVQALGDYMSRRKAA